MPAVSPASGHGAWIFILTWSPHAVGGVNEVVFAMADQVRSRGYVPIIAIAGWDGATPAQIVRGVEVVSLRLRQPVSTTPPHRWLPGAVKTLLPDIRALLRLVRTRNAAVLNPHFPTLECSLLTWLRRLGLLRIPVVASFHGLDVKELKTTTGTARRLWLSILRCLDGVVVVSSAMKEEIAGFAPETSVAVIQNGVAARTFLKTAEWRESPARILHIGKFEHKKAHDLLLIAFRRLLSDGIRARLVLVGASGPKLEETRALITELGLSAEVSVHVDVVHDRMPQFFSDAQVFVLPSRSEGLPLALLEAGAAGVPIVATSVGGVPEVVRDEITGLLIPPDDANALETALRRLLTDGALRERLRDSMREDILARWSWEIAGKKYCELLNAIPS